MDRWFVWSGVVEGFRDLHTDRLDVGELRAFLGRAPDGWLRCDGSALDAETYPELAALVGANLPDLRRNPAEPPA